jgi:hypothetical protein
MFTNRISAATTRCLQTENLDMAATALPFYLRRSEPRDAPRLCRILSEADPESVENPYVLFGQQDIDRLM